MPHSSGARAAQRSPTAPGLVSVCIRAPDQVVARGAPLGRARRRRLAAVGGARRRLTRRFAATRVRGARGLRRFADLRASTCASLICATSVSRLGVRLRVRGSAPRARHGGTIRTRRRAADAARSARASRARRAISSGRSSRAPRPSPPGVEERHDVVRAPQRHAATRARLPRRGDATVPSSRAPHAPLLRALASSRRGSVRSRRAAVRDRRTASDVALCASASRGARHSSPRARSLHASLRRDVCALRPTARSASIFAPRQKKKWTTPPRRSTGDARVGSVEPSA